MPLSEADTRAKLIDPAIHARGWTEEFICREQTLGTDPINVNARPGRVARPSQRLAGRIRREHGSIVERGHRVEGRTPSRLAHVELRPVQKESALKFRRFASDMRSRRQSRPVSSPTIAAPTHSRAPGRWCICREHAFVKS